MGTYAWCTRTSSLKVQSASSTLSFSLALANASTSRFCPSRTACSRPREWMLDDASISPVTSVTSVASMSSIARPAAPAMTTAPRLPPRACDVAALIVPAALALARSARMTLGSLDVLMIGLLSQHHGIGRLHDVHARAAQLRHRALGDLGEIGRRRQRIERRRRHRAHGVLEDPDLVHQ